jgi:integrase/recombinase XerD
MNTKLMLMVESKMSDCLSQEQSARLHMVLKSCIAELEPKIDQRAIMNDKDIISAFISAKKVEGCSGRTLKYYKQTIDKVTDTINKPLRLMSTEDLRGYLSDYQNNNGVGRVTMDNVRRIMSSFYSWLEDEDYILKSPVRRIKKVKVPKEVKNVYSDEDLVIMRDGCAEKRDLALVDLLYSTGMRVGELVKLNRDDIDFENRECIVCGKGDKERKVYFDARAKIHLQDYTSIRKDDNDALFVSLHYPYERLNIRGVESRLKSIGDRLRIEDVYPHKFRRTLATVAIDKGMPIEQVQKLLGHQRIDTTMEYAIVNQNNVKISHQKYLG